MIDRMMGSIERVVAHQAMSMHLRWLMRRGKWQEFGKAYTMWSSSPVVGETAALYEVLAVRDIGVHEAVKLGCFRAYDDLVEEIARWANSAKDASVTKVDGRLRRIGPYPASRRRALRLIAEQSRTAALALLLGDDRRSFEEILRPRRGAFLDTYHISADWGLKAQVWHAWQSLWRDAESELGTSPDGPGRADLVGADGTTIVTSEALSTLFNPGKSARVKRSPTETPGVVTIETAPPDGEVLTVTLVSDARYYARGLDRLDARDPDGAIAELTRAIELRPDWPAPRYQRAWAQYQAGRIDAAIADYDRVIEMAPKWAAPFIGRSLARRGKGEYDAALADATRAVELDPRRSSARYDRGTIHWVMGHEPEALADFGEAVGLAPADRGPWFWRGMFHLVAGRHEAAEADMRKSLDVSPPDKRYLALHGLCVVLLHRGKDEEMTALLAEQLSQENSKLTSWDRASLQYVAGTLSEEKLYALAAREDKPETLRTVAEKTLSAHFFVAMKASAAGDRVRAAEPFRKCIETGVVHYTGFTIARAWLARHAE
jgi:tetratricopeptide (TPR) repeat protein